MSSVPTRGQAHAPHKGYVFSNAWVHQTVESMCIALMVDAQGDKDMVAIPNYTRMNRVPPPHEYPGSEDIDYGPGSTTNTKRPTGQSAKTAAPSSPAIVNRNGGAGLTAATGSRKSSGNVIESKVWI